MKKEHPAHPAADGDDGLSIGELSSRTGVPAATLRTWDARHGFPDAGREGGRRRYRASDVGLVDEVLRHRQAGLALPAAIEAVRRRPPDGDGSFFAQVQAACPDLPARVLPIDLLLALSWAVEDEYCARAGRPVLTAAFQRATVYRRAASRWRELSRTAAATVVLADFEQLAEPSPLVMEVPLDIDAPARREWVIICDSADHPACVIGWELADPAAAAKPVRRFETIWSLDPDVVRQSTHIGLALLARLDPRRAERVSEHLGPSGGRASVDLRRANGLFARVLAYAAGPAYSHRSPGDLPGPD